MVRHAQLCKTSTHGSALQAGNISVVMDSFQDLQREEQVKGSRAELVGGLFTEWEAALAQQGLSALAEKARQELACGKVSACNDSA